jgi:hypothetical protein
MTKLSKINRSKVAKVYSGDLRGCWCGCAGNWSETPRSVSIVCTKLEKAAADGAKVEYDNKADCLYTRHNGRTYAAYFAAEH